MNVGSPGTNQNPNMHNQPTQSAGNQSGYLSNPNEPYYQDENDPNQQNDQPQLEFTYHHDFDENGALHYLGTLGGQSPYKNPYEINQIKVFFSSMGKGSYEDFVGRRLANCRTLNEPNAFMGVDLGLDRWLLPNTYSIRNRDSNRHCLMNWVFEASLDFKTWFIMDRRIHMTDDPKYNLLMQNERHILEKRGSSTSWSVDKNYLKTARNVLDNQGWNGGFR